MSEPTTLEDVLEAIADRQRPVSTATELAEELPIKRRMTLNKLQDLEERGDVVSQDVGARARVWYPASLLEWWDRHGETHAFSVYSDDEPAGGTDEFDPEFDVDAALEEATQDGPTPTDVDVSKFYDDWAGNHVETRVEAARVALGRLRDAREADAKSFRSAGDVQEWADELGPPNQSPDTFWRKTIRPAFKHAADEGKTEYVRNKGWRWIGGDRDE